ncbi:uncharacterized protein LOC117647195 [Thrips palmi]|uniref:Uncharacterized protein LOC117647195 n=1 Tax=Thrips palmi TaxID=161013 RepID=A0A6P8Z4L4_THRPL|nr:uncharacterized protein LOC117647195 [Thrips palmi]
MQMQIKWRASQMMAGCLRLTMLESRSYMILFCFLNLKLLHPSKADIHDSSEASKARPSDIQSVSPWCHPARPQDVLVAIQDVHGMSLASKECHCYVQSVSPWCHPARPQDVLAAIQDVHGMSLASKECHCYVQSVSSWCHPARPQDVRRMSLASKACPRGVTQRVHRTSAGCPWRPKRVPVVSPSASTERPRCLPGRPWDVPGV